MLNAFWVIMVLAALAMGALSGRMAEVAKASTDAAGSAVTLAIGLVGVMAFWIGAMRVLEQAGVLQAIARGLRAPMRWLFPDVPANHPAMSLMIMNFTSNLLGLANAATPFGLKAMTELDKLNRDKGTATNAMALFLAINTSSIALLPTGMIALRASLGSTQPGSIFFPTLVATTCSTLTAIVMAKLLCRLPLFRGTTTTELVADPDLDLAAAAPVLAKAASGAPLTGRHRALWWTVFCGVDAALLYGLWELAIGTPTAMLPFKQALGGAQLDGQGWTMALKTLVTDWPLPLLIGLIIFVGWARKVKIYDCIVEGGKEGFDIALRIIPYLVAILVAVGMLRASGAIELLARVLDPITGWIGMPGEALPMALLRPLTGSGAYAIAADIMKAHGADSLIGNIVATMQGSTETTFYVLALYFGVVQIKRVRHTLVACLCADAVGITMSVWAVRFFLG